MRLWHSASVRGLRLVPGMRWLVEIDVALKETMPVDAQAEHGTTKGNRVFDGCAHHVLVGVGLASGLEALPDRVYEVRVLRAICHAMIEHSRVVLTWR